MDADDMRDYLDRIPDVLPTCTANLGQTRYQAFADIPFPQSRMPASIEFSIKLFVSVCLPISGIIEIRADIGVNIVIYRYRRTMRRYPSQCLARIQMTIMAYISKLGTTYSTHENNIPLRLLSLLRIYL
jgi:hypothetical protein